MKKIIYTILFCLVSMVVFSQTMKNDRKLNTGSDADYLTNDENGQINISLQLTLGAMLAVLMIFLRKLQKEGLSWNAQQQGMCRVRNICSQVPGGLDPAGESGPSQNIADSRCLKKVQ